MIDLIIVSLILIVVILLLIIAFLTFYIIYEHRKCTVNSWKQKNNNNNNEQRVVVPLLTLKTNDRSSGDHSNSASLISTPKRMTKRLRHRSRTLFIRTQNSQGFLLSTQSSSPSPMDQTSIQFDY